MKRYKQLFVEDTSSYTLATKLILEEAKSRNIKVSIIDEKEQLILLEKGELKEYYIKGVTSANSNVSASIARSKGTSKLIFVNNSVNTTDFKVYALEDKEKALNNYKSCKNKEIVIKPNEASKGNGISFLFKGFSEEDYKSAVNKAFKFTFDEKIIIEDYFRGGKEYRIFIVKEKCIGVSEKQPPFVVGDGVNTIKKLIELENKNDLRGVDDRLKSHRVIVIDEDLKSVLEKNKLSLDSVLKKDEKVFLRINANINTGGISENLNLKDIHPSYLELGLEIARATSLQNFCAIDIKIDDITEKAGISNYNILEVNSSPGFASFVFPYSGKPVEIHKHLLDCLGF